MPTSNYAVTVPFVDALAGLGLRHVCITPGSRSTPLSMAFAAHPDITDWSHHDERSSSFFALGVAKTTASPVALVCTSGTAAAEFLPAAVEARHARVPLLLLTADRPPELRDVGAPQAVDQVKMFGTAVKWAHEVGTPTEGVGAAAGALAAHAWAAATDLPAGPVHLNFPFLEPLVPDTSSAPPTSRRPRLVPGRLAPNEATIAEMAGFLNGKRVLIVCGPQDDAALAGPLADLAAAGGYPIVADGLSQLRAGTHNLAPVIGAGHALASAGFLDAHRPDVVLRFGAVPTSKALWTWLGTRPETPQILVEPAGWRDPEASATSVVRADPALHAAALLKTLRGGADDAWMPAWRRADDAAAAALAAVAVDGPFPSEPAVAAMLGASLPAGATLWTASSMPVRDVDTFLAARSEPLRIMSNRGANGIDGFLSSGLGSAAASESPTYLHAGDLSALHDLTALAAAARYDIPATIVVVNNDGGGIFHFLPQTEFPDVFERHFGTPHGLDFTRLAGAFDVPAMLVTTRTELHEALTMPPDGPNLVEVRTDRAENVEVHRAAHSAVAEAVAALT